MAATREHQIWSMRFFAAASVPPAIDGLHNGVAIIPLLRQTIGVLPAAAEDEVIAFPPHVGFTVEVPQQKGGLFCARCLRQRFPLGSKRLLFVLPPAHVHRIIPDVSCTDAQCAAGLPVAVIVCFAQQQVFGCGDGRTAEHRRALIVNIVADLSREPAPVVVHAPLFQHPGHRCGVVVHFQRHPIARAGIVPCRSVPQQRSGGGLVHLLQGEHLRLLRCDKVYKDLPLGLIVRLDEAVGIQSQ